MMRIVLAPVGLSSAFQSNADSLHLLQLEKSRHVRGVGDGVGENDWPNVEHPTAFKDPNDLKDPALQYNDIEPILKSGRECTWAILHNRSTMTNPRTDGICWSRQLSGQECGPGYDRLMDEAVCRAGLVIRENGKEDGRPVVYNYDGQSGIDNCNHNQMPSEGCWMHSGLLRWSRCPVKPRHYVPPYPENGGGGHNFGVICIPKGKKLEPRKPACPKGTLQLVHYVSKTQNGCSEGGYPLMNSTACRQGWTDSVRQYAKKYVYAGYDAEARFSPEGVKAFGLDKEEPYSAYRDNATEKDANAFKPGCFAYFRREKQSGMGGQVLVWQDGGRGTVDGYGVQACSMEVCYHAGSTLKTTTTTTTTTKPDTGENCKSYESADSCPEPRCSWDAGAAVCEDPPCETKTSEETCCKDCEWKEGKCQPAMFKACPKEGKPGSNKCPRGCTFVDNCEQCGYAATIWKKDFSLKPWAARTGARPQGCFRNRKFDIKCNRFEPGSKYPNGKDKVGQKRGKWPICKIIEPEKTCGR